MLVKGIRSFSPDNNNVIEFYKPLTLIVGSNGAGKTVRSCSPQLPAPWLCLEQQSSAASEHPALQCAASPAATAACNAVATLCLLSCMDAADHY